MNEVLTFWQSLKQFYYSLPQGIGGQSWVRTLCYFVFFFCVFWALERAYGARGGNYRSRNFLHDTLYWFFERVGLRHYLFVAVIVASIPVDWRLFEPAPFAHLPFVAQVIIFLLLNDFISYWMHRALHHFKFLWAFHSVHHSQEQLTFATGGRFHPIEAVVTNLLVVVLFQALGLVGLLAFPLSSLLMLQAELEHTRIPWRFGPFYKVFVSPAFHSYHHATNLEYRDKHFGQTFVFWDHLFGTVVKPDAPAPTVFGVEEVKPQTLLDTLLIPFRLLYEYYGDSKSDRKSARPPG